MSIGREGKRMLRFFIVDLMLLLILIVHMIRLSYLSWQIKKIWKTIDDMSRHINAQYSNIRDINNRVRVCMRNQKRGKEDE